MKQIILALTLLIAGQTAGFAQCDKTVLINSSKTEYLDGTGTLKRTVDENSIIEISKSNITIAPGNGEKMYAVIKSDSCNWKTPYKEGKTIIKAVFNREDGKTMNSTITLEGRDDKLTLLMETEEMPDKKIRVVIDKFEEKK